VEELSPTDRLFITQVGLEPLLRDRAAELGAEHRFGTALVSFEQHDDGVRSVIRPRDGGPDEVITSDYLVAADGAHSGVRDQLGIGLTGRGSFADCVTIYFKADVKELMGDRNLSVVYVNHPTLLGFFRFSITGDSGFLAVFATIGPGGERDTRVGDHVSTEQCVELVRTALGASAELPVEIENVQEWSASAGVAEIFSRGRVFLAGDSAHVMPPTGGFGGNTGVADAHNLAWKLAVVTQGLAGPGLLASYDDERRPISALTVEQAYTRYALRVDPTLPRDDLQPPLDDASIELGAIYRSDAVLDGDPPDQPLDDPRSQSWLPGTRAPHLWVDGRSTVDVAGHGFALMVTHDADGWSEVASQTQQVLGVPVAVQRLDGVTEWQGAALVRPDGVVAWRTGGAPATAGLQQALTGILGRVPGD
jgi:2-polyprenyl-6-methoxyphenol hydroxylase-like FAD-dependent oxidoreductase